MRAIFISVFILFVLAVGIGVYTNAHRNESMDASNISGATASTTQEFPVLPEVYAIPGQRSYYKNDAFGFVFERPGGFTIEEYGVADPDPQVLLKGSDGSKAMLVWIYPVGNVTQVTNSLVQKVDPSSKITSTVSSFTAGEASGVSFDADGGTWDDGHQYWFIHDGILFRVYTARSFQDADAAVLGTWRFTDIRGR